jgi:uncharacterized membrane protein (UPF0127 family)
VTERVRGETAVFALALLALPALPACRASPSSLAAADAPAAAPRVIVESPSGRSASVRVEVARTDPERERGLMFRRELGADDGMLFVFPESSDHVFWMKNTFVALDMIFLSVDDEDGGVVVGIVANAEPMTTTPRGVGVPSRFVLEVNGGWSATHGLARGDRVRFEGIGGH